MRRAKVQDLLVWQKSMKLAELCYQLTGDFPESEKFGMISQIRRAAISIPANIAEGNGRGSQADFTRFLHISLGSARELETLLLLSKNLKITEADLIDTALNQTEEVCKMLFSLIQKLKNS